MATNVGLPQGFVLDNVPKTAGLPQGFVMDSSMPPSPNFMQRMKEDFKGREQNLLDNRIRNLQGQSDTATNLTAIGQGFGVVGDVGANAMGSVGREVWDQMPDYMKQFYIQNLLNPAKEAAQSPVGQAMKQGIGSVVQEGQELVQEYPTTAGLAGAAGNLASIAPMGAGIKGASQTPKVAGEALQAAGSVLEGSGANIVAEGFNEMVRPALKSAKDIEKAAGQGKLESSFWKGAQKEMSNRDIKAAREVENLGSVKYNESPVKAAGKIKEALDSEISIFNDKLAANDVKLPKEQVNIALRKKLAASIKNKADSDYVGQYRDLMKDVQNYLPAKGRDVSLTDLLDARKKFDVEYKTGKVVKGGKEARYNKKIIGDVRETLNDMIAQQLPEKGIRESLQKQSNLYHALGNVSEKIPKDATRSLPGRIMSKAVDVLPGNTDIKKALAGVGLAGAAAATGTLPVALGAAGIWGTRKIYNSPAVRKVLGLTLSKSGELLKDGKAISTKGASKLAEKKGLLGLSDEELLKRIEENN